MKNTVLFLLVTIWSSVDADPTFPAEIWKAVETAYQTEILLSYDEYEGESIVIEEFYNKEHKAGCVEVTTSLEFGRYNYYTQSKQTFFVHGENNLCEVEGLADYPGIHYNGWLFETADGNTDNFIFGPSAMLRATDDSNMTFAGYQEVRDRNTTRWTTLMDGYALIYYLSMDENKPIRITISGSQTDPVDPDDGAEVRIFYYDYIMFNSYLDPAKEKKLLVYRGADCENRITLNPDKIEVPQIPHEFETHMEFIIQHPGAQESVQKAWMYYDRRRNLTRVDEVLGNEFLNSRVRKNIYDYTTGIAYVIDESTGKCTATATIEGTFSNMGFGSIAGIIFSNSDDIFLLDASYVFSGYDETRGVKTERWTSTRRDVPDGSGGLLPKAVIDFQLLSEDVYDAGERKGVAIPIRMDLTVYTDDTTNEVDYTEVVNFLHFSSQEEYLSDKFDATECFQEPTQREWLRITFQGIWEHGISTHLNEFQQQLIEQIARGTGTSFVRMPEMEIDHDENFVYSVMLLLEASPSLLQFSKNPNKIPTKTDTQVSNSIDDPNLCSRECLTNDNFDCKSFYECNELEKNCFLSDSVNSTSESLQISPCSYYVKTVDSKNQVQPSNKDVEKWLKDQIINQQLVYYYPYVDEKNQTVNGNYTAIRLKRELLVEDPLLVDFLREDFIPLEHGVRIQDDYVKMQATGLSYTQCLLTCEGYQPFRCETFSFCYDAGKCYLSDTVFVNPLLASEVTYDGDCTTITRQRLDDYTPTYGAILMTDISEEYGGIEDANYCAYLCDMIDYIVCRSFDYCYAEQTCYLHESHALDDDSSGDLNLNATYCTHFSRNFLVDFEEHENVEVSGERDIFIENISVDNCAKQCIETPDYACNGFDFCMEDDKMTCFLTEAHYSGTGTTINTNTKCDHYERTYYDGKDINTIVNSQEETVEGYSPGDMAGLAIGVLVSTMGLCFLGYYFYTKKYA